MASAGSKLSMVIFPGSKRGASTPDFQKVQVFYGVNGFSWSGYQIVYGSTWFCVVLQVPAAGCRSALHCTLSFRLRVPPMNDMSHATSAATFPLPAATPVQLGFHEPALEKLRALIRGHIAEGRYPGAQIALARHGQLALFETFGKAALGRAAAADTLWLLFSNTKVMTASGIWALVEDGLLAFFDRVADHMPEFAQHGKGEITHRARC